MGICFESIVSFASMFNLSWSFKESDVWNVVLNLPSNIAPNNLTSQDHLGFSLGFQIASFWCIYNIENMEICTTRIKHNACGSGFSYKSQRSLERSTVSALKTLFVGFVVEAQSPKYKLPTRILAPMKPVRHIPFGPRFWAIFF